MKKLAIISLSMSLSTVAFCQTPTTLAPSCVELNPKENPGIGQVLKDASSRPHQTRQILQSNMRMLAPMLTGVNDRNNLEIKNFFINMDYTRILYCQTPAS